MSLVRFRSEAPPGLQFQGKETAVCGRSSSGRAPPCQGGGSEFEPRRPLQTNSKEPVYAGFLLIMVTWPSGKARVCKTLIRQFKSARHLHKTVMKKCHSLFCCIVENWRFRQPIFGHGFTVLSNHFRAIFHPDAHYFCRFLEFGRGGNDFLRKNRIISAAFRRFSISPPPISHWLRGFFAFSDSFQFLFEFSIFYLYIK